MKIVVTAGGADLDAPAHPNFGRCPLYLFVDPETMTFEAVENPALNAPGGAGIQAAQFVIQRGAGAVITSHIGPNAFRVLSAADIPIYRWESGTVRQAVEAFREGQLSPLSGATDPEHAGPGRRGGGSSITPSAEVSRQEEIARLKQAAADLRRQLSDLMERIHQLEKGAE